MPERHDSLIAQALAALPALAPPSGALAGARRRLEARRATRAPRAARWTAGAVTAATAVLVAAAVLLRTGGVPPRDVPSPAASPALAALLAESARLEAELAALRPADPRRVATAYTVALLEDRIALLDDELSVVAVEPVPAGYQERLWQERVTVMSSLLSVRTADALVER